MSLLELKKILNDLLEKGHQEGLYREDYSTLVYLLSQSNPMKNADQEWIDFNKDLLDLKRNFHDAGLLTKYSQNNCQYIVSHSSILALALANNISSKIKLDNHGGYLFCCHFHPEKRPSMRVSEDTNTVYCHSCKISYNAISYLMNFEQCSFKDSIDLLAQIFRFELPYFRSNKKDLVEHYQEALLSQEYEMLIQNIYQQMLEISTEEHAESFITSKKDLITRIRNNEFDKNFVYEEPAKKFYLK